VSKTPEQMWDDFIALLAEVQPLAKVDPKNPQPQPLHKNFIGSVESYKKIFMQANEKE